MNFSKNELRQLILQAFQEGLGSFEEMKESYADKVVEEVFLKQEELADLKPNWWDQKIQQTTIQEIVKEKENVDYVEEMARPWTISGDWGTTPDVNPVYTYTYGQGVTVSEPLFLNLKQSNSNVEFWSSDKLSQYRRLIDSAAALKAKTCNKLESEPF